MASSVSQNATPSPLAETTPTPTVTISFAANDSNSVAENSEGPRPQAEPLPRKRGEIGFHEGVQDVPGGERQASPSTPSLPERHPADRDQPASSEAGTSSGEPPRSPSRAESTNTTTTTESAGKRSLISFLKPKRIPTVGGLRLTTLGLFLFQFSIFAATITGWVLVVTRMQKSSSHSDPAPPPKSTGANTGSDSDGPETSVFNTTSAQIFVHVAFGIVSLAELIFLERSVFRLRAERYGHVHPGEILPRAQRRAEQEASMGFAPWNRPPLPTYAAALAQSGVGTGDVEDNIIAIPPPPAYGHTRGSRLLLAGFLPDTLRAQRPRSDGSMQSRGSNRSSRSSRREEGEEGDRPKSYMSTDPEWEARCDADRALVLEETLAQLEEGNARSRHS